MMSHIKALTLLALGLLAFNSKADGSVTLSPVSIRFSDQTSVDGESVKLGEIARVIAGDERIVAQLETLEVAKSAGFGLTRCIDTDFLFKRYLKSFDNRYLLDVERKVIRVTTRSNPLPKDSLPLLIEKFLSEQPKLSGQIRHWEIARTPEAIAVPVTPYSLVLSFQSVKRKGKVDLNLAIRSENRILRNISITVNVRVEEPVLVARVQINRGVLVDKENVSLEMRETTQINDLVITGPNKLMGSVAKVTIAKGRIVTPNMLALPALVKRGQEAKIILHNGTVNVTSDAVCRQDGVMGQIILAKSLASNRLIRVRVTENGALEPIPGG